jgi:hypothetical protein
MSSKVEYFIRAKNRLSTAIDDLLTDIENGDKFMKVYKQMKMYNDDELNLFCTKTRSKRYFEH